MTVTRRVFLASGSISAAAMAHSARALAARNNQITVFDSRLAQSQMFAAGGRSGGPSGEQAARQAFGQGSKIDVAQNSVSLWSELRKVPAKTIVAGLTRWSDFIAIRGQLESNGLRVRHFQQQGELIDWAMR